MKIIGLILARGQSKGILRKNIKILNEKPLISWIIEEAKKSKLLGEIVISSEDSEILSEATKLGVKSLVRPLNLAQDDSKSIDAVKHFFSVIDCDIVVLLNACCPLTKVEDIDNTIKLALEIGCDSVVSLVEDFSCHPTKVCRLYGDNKVMSLGGLEFITNERQKLEKCFKRNTAIYLAKKEVIESGTFFGKDCRGFVMPKERSWDINDEWDFKVAEFLLKQNETS